MLIENTDGTFTLGPADVICILRLPAGTYHVAIMEEFRSQWAWMPFNLLKTIHLKTCSYHTLGAHTLEGAQQEMAELRQKFTVDDANVVADVALNARIPRCIIQVQNWVTRKTSLKEALRPFVAG